MPTTAIDLWEVTDRVNAALWFFDLGVHVFPTHNKKPAVTEGTSQFDYRCSRAKAAGFKEYGVPGGVREGYDDGLTIVDTDDDADEAWVAAQPALDTPFMVRTRRGWHRVLRTCGPLPSYIRRDGHTIENRNRGLYVVGASSVLPNGFVYRASAWSWRWEDIPYFPDGFVFDDGSCGRISPERTAGTPGEEYEFPEAVYTNFRHHELFRLLRSCKGKGWERDETRQLVTLANENRCHPPLVEDRTFERWFTRGWNKPDRPFEVPAASLEGLDGVRGL